VIPFKPADDLWSALVPGLVLLVLLGGAAAFAAWKARRRGWRPGRAAGRRRLDIVERLPLSRRAVLHVVEYNGRVLLIGECATGLTRLADDAPPREQGDAAG
jgi:hypothetical protein